VAKKKTKRIDHERVRENTVKLLKSTGNTLRAVIGLAALFSFVVIPFLHGKLNDVVAQCIWYPSCVLFLGFAISNALSKPRKNTESPLFTFLGNIGIFLAFILIGSAFLINYYDTFYNWWWAIFVFVAFSLPIILFGSRKFLQKEKAYTTEQLKASLKTCWKYVGFYWLIDLFYMAIFNYWLTYGDSRSVWLALQFVFGGLAMVFVFYNLTIVFLSTSKKRGWGLLQDFIWGIAITVYLIFMIPGESLQTIVLTITAAVYGGLLTLVGVAWTIKDNAEKLKQERKLSIRPFLQVHHDFLTKMDEIPSDGVLYITIGDIITIQRKLPDEISAFQFFCNHPEKSLDHVAKSSMLSQYFASHALIYTEIENCGAGNAIDTKLRYNDGTISSFCVTTSTPQKLLLILKDELFEPNKEEYIEIKLSLEYTDISSLGKYEQSEHFMFGRDACGNLYMSQMQDDLLTAPEEID
jgi:hypothetical protein